MRSARSAALALLFVFPAFAPVFAGDLNPPAGPVAPTQKTLDEVEPRIPIHQADVPLFIGSPGSYVLAEPLAATGATPVITIDADDVSIDLAGFVISGGPGSTNAFADAAPHLRVTIRNGTVRSFDSVGLDLVDTDDVTVRDLFVADCSGFGMHLGDGVIVERVHVDNCGGTGVLVGRSAVISRSVSDHNLAGFITDQSATITDCSATLNDIYGYSLLSGDATFHNCAALGNGSHGFNLAFTATADNCLANDNDGAGFAAASGSVLTACIARANSAQGFSLGFGLPVGGTLVSSCHAYANLGEGFLCSDGCSIMDSDAKSNTTRGVSLADDCRVVRCDLVANNVGIYSEGADNHIEGNKLTDNARGIQLINPGNVVFRNTASGNTILDFDIAPGNDVGPIGSAAASTSPYANIQY